MSEESRNPDAPVAGTETAREGGSAVGRSEPPTLDRGRKIALGTLAGLVLLGGILIARGPRSSPAARSASTSASAEGAALTAAELPSLSLSASLSTRAVRPAAAEPGFASEVDAGARFVPTWRVAALEHEPGVELLRGAVGKRTLGAALAQTSLTKNEIQRITRALENVRRIERGSPKDAFVIARDRAKGAVVAFEYVASPTEIWQAKSEDLPNGVGSGAAGSEGRLIVTKLELFVEKKRTLAAVAVTADLAQAIAASGLREEAIEEIDDALEGHGDAAIIKPGVRLRIVGSEEWIEGAFTRFRVDAVEYVPHASDPSPVAERPATLRVYYYERDAANQGSRRRMPAPGYYDTRGQQPFRGAFRAPVPLARITSRFNPKRMHPVLHVVMPHNGIDFGASTGTPVFASGAGILRSAGDGGPCGNMVQIDHANGLTTAYCHLSRFAPGLHAGQHVEARQLVGYVGQTGRVTGPHLHFAVKRGATFIDPMALKMDGVRILPPADRDDFARRRAELDAALDAIALPVAVGGAPSDDKNEKDEPSGEE